MKASNSRQFSSVAARTLKVVGIILILSALLDCIVLSLPGETSDILNRAWQLAAATQIVDRGIIPLSDDGNTHEVKIELFATQNTFARADAG